MTICLNETNRMPRAYARVHSIVAGMVGVEPWALKLLSLR